MIHFKYGNLDSSSFTLGVQILIFASDSVYILHFLHINRSDSWRRRKHTWRRSYTSRSTSYWSDVHLANTLSHTSTDQTAGGREGTFASDGRTSSAEDHGVGGGESWSSPAGLFLLYLMFFEVSLSKPHIDHDNGAHVGKICLCVCVFVNVIPHICRTFVRGSLLHVLTCTLDPCYMYLHVHLIHAICT